MDSRDLKTPKRILVVDDEEDILDLIAYNLKKEGYTVICAETGEKALEEALAADLIILDLMLPGIDGLEVTRRLKENPQTRSIPILMLTAKGEEADIVAGLELGADDYVTKPFSNRVLLARIRAVGRRGKTDEPGEKNEIVIHDLVIDCGRRAVTVEEAPVDLTFSEFQLLVYLANRPGWVFTRSQIVDAVHGSDYPVTERSVDVQIVGLRKKLGPYGKYIETVRGVGYRFKEDR